MIVDFCVLECAIVHYIEVGTSLFPFADIHRNPKLIKASVSPSITGTTLVATSPAKVMTHLAAFEEELPKL